MNKDKALFRQEREKLLLTGEIPRLFMKYALPGVAGLLFLGIQSVIDGIAFQIFLAFRQLPAKSTDILRFQFRTCGGIEIAINATCLAEGDVYVDACHNYIVSVEELLLFLLWRQR